MPAWLTLRFVGDIAVDCNIIVLIGIVKMELGGVPGSSNDGISFGQSFLHDFAAEACAATSDEPNLRRHVEL